MENQFIRTEMLLGSEKMEKLKNSKIAIFGVGGVGGYAVEALARSGIYNLTIVDNDIISISNINRQIIATYDTVGKYKVDALKDRILSINPKANVTTVKMFFLPTNQSEFDFTPYDYVIDAIDTISGKITLCEICQKLNIPIISSMGAGNKLNPLDFEVSDIYKTSVCPLAKVMRQELKKRDIKKLKVVYSKEIPIKPFEIETNCTNEQNSELKADIKDELNKIATKRQTPASNAFVPSTVGLIIASEVIKDLIK